MEIVSLRMDYVMVKPNALINPMRVTNIVASNHSNSTTLLDAVVTQKLNGPVPTVSASKTLNTVMAKPSVRMDLTKATNIVASKNTRSTTTKNADVKRVSGSAPTAIVFLLAVSVMAKPSVLMNPMRVTRTAASRHSTITILRCVDVIQPVNWLVIMVNAS
jgi:hypothetical protein